MGLIVKSYVRKAIKAVPPLYRAINKARGWRIHDADRPEPIVALGGDGGDHNYGAWAIPESLHLDKRSIVYSAGVGFDVSFDRALIDLFGCTVHACDPGDKVAASLARSRLPPEFKFEKVALGTTDGNVAYAALGASGVSALAVAADTQAEFLPTKTLRALMQENGHEHIDLLKMDIEGAEYDVVDQMLDQGIHPTCVLVEFHHFQLGRHAQTKASVDALKAAGYRNFWVSDLGAEYGFVKG